MNNDPLDSLFDSFSSETFRFETLEEYRIEDTAEYEEFLAHQRGEETSPPANQAWYDEVSAWTSSGRRVVRVRLMPSELNPYLRYEVSMYPNNERAGEVILAISRIDYEKLELGPPRDYWLFDGKVAAEMKYSTDGRYEESFKSEDKIYLEMRDALLRNSIPLSDFLAKVP